jgi:transposase-like protein
MRRIRREPHRFPYKQKSPLREMRTCEHDLVARTVEERHQAVLELMAGKATVDQIARRLGVHASTVEGWRNDALGGTVEALRRGNGKTPRELELAKKADQLERVVTKLSIQKCQLEQALDIERASRPTGGSSPGVSHDERWASSATIGQAASSPAGPTPVRVHPALR